MDIYVGDKVQIKNGGIDVTNGNRAKSGRYYGEGGPLTAEVVLIDDNWKTGGKWGLPTTVTKVRCSNKGIVVWQVRPEDIVVVIKASRPETVQTEPEKPAPTLPPTDQGKEDLTPKVTRVATTVLSNHEYVIPEGQSSWGSGVKPTAITTGRIPTTAKPKTKLITKANAMAQPSSITYKNRGTGTLRKLNRTEKNSIGTNVQIDDSIKVMHQKTAWEDPNKKRQILSNDIENIQNAEAFPILSRSSQGLLAAKYDYQIIPGDQRLSKIVKLEDSLMQARAALGLQVHGNNDIAKAVKYYMYNRFKTPDTNLAHNKSVTYVFFTRPDLNLLTPGSYPTANSQTLNHSESSLIWRRNPELFKLLTDCNRCGDHNNFNMLLSNQVTSFDIKDEEITSVKAGMSWNDYEMVYGDSYTGRAAGEFTCNFTETSDYSIINLIKLWITYIDNVARGSWSPSYQLGADRTGINKSHVFTKTLDYGASVYVFKCGPDGEDVLYWSKYYGVFPMNTGANALSWDLTTPIGEAPKLNIRFSYSFKKDLSPISLIEFNNIAGVTSELAMSENSFNVELGHSSRPYVGAPFIQMNLNNDPTMTKGGVDYARKKSSIRLKFRKYSDSRLTDDLLYRSSMDGRSI